MIHFPSKSLFDQEMHRSSSVETALNALQNVKRSDFPWVYVEPIIKFLHLVHFLDDPILIEMLRRIACDISLNYYILPLISEILK